MKFRDPVINQLLGGSSQLVSEVVNNHGDRKSPKWGQTPLQNGLNGFKQKGVTNHLLSGMILQVGTMFSQRFSQHVSSWAWKSWNEKKPSIFEAQGRSQEPGTRNIHDFIKI